MSEPVRRRAAPAGVGGLALMVLGVGVLFAGGPVLLGAAVVVLGLLVLSWAVV